MAASYSDLSEHVGTLVTLLGLAAAIAGFFFWKLISRNLDETRELNNKMDGWQETHTICREKQESERAALVEKFDKGLASIREDRRTDWNIYFWKHIHDIEGDVKIPKKNSG